MAWRKIDDTKLTAVADAVREQLITTDKIPLDDMPGMIRSIGIGVVPGYWQAHLAEKAAAINAALDAAGENRSAFLWYTDAHWATNYGTSPVILKYLSKNTGMDKTFFGGDIANEKTGEIDAITAWQEMVKDIPNHHAIIGNHDNNCTDFATVPQKADFFVQTGRTGDMAIGTHATNGKMYFYIDNHIESTRYICLSTGRMYTNADEVAWCIEVLNSTPKNWHIVVISHLWLNNDYNNGGAILTTPVNYTQGYLDMFDAYNYRLSGTESFTGTAYIFTNAQAKIEFIIGGHVHQDYDFTTAKGIPVILTECDAWQERSDTSVAKQGTTTENCVYAIVADYGAKTVRIINVGRGSTRSLAIPHVSLYTNQLPISTDADGTIYNGKGYTENTRLSTSSSGPTTGNGWCTTGFIPCKIGDTIRFKNMEFFDISGDGGSTSRSTIIAYKSDFTTNGMNMTYSRSNSPSDAWKPVYDDRGDLVQFTMPTSLNSSQAYIRLSCGYLDENSIITVNEEID